MATAVEGLPAGTSAKDENYVHAASWYAEQDVDLRLGTRATALDTAAHTLTLDGGDSLDYSKLLLTTGSATACRLDVPGIDLGGGFTLRTIDDAEAFCAAIGRGGSVVGVGASDN